MYRSLVSPFIAQIEITNRCPNKCVHCYNYWRHEYEEKKFPKDDLVGDDLDLILRKLDEERVFCLVVTGGEPLMNKEGMYQVLDFVERSELMTVNINSSLIGLTKDDVRKLSFYKKLTGILTSISSYDQEAHDFIVQNKGAFLKTASGMKMLVEAGIPVSVNMVVSKLNKDHVVETGRLAKDFGAKVFNVTRAVKPINCLDFGQYALTPDEMRSCLSDLDNVKKLSIPVGSLGVCPLCLIENPVEHSVIAGKRCSAGITAIAVSTNGDVRPCTHIDLSYGNILEETLNEAWLRMEKWRDGSLISTKCRKCKVLPFCGGGCRADAFVSNGSYDSEDSLMSSENLDPLMSIIQKPKSTERPTIGRNLKLNDRIRWRREEFGSSVFLNNKHLGLLDAASTEALFTIDNPDISVLEKRFGSEFIYELFERKVLIEQGPERR